MKRVNLKNTALLTNLIQLVAIVALVTVSVLTFGSRLPFLNRLGLNFFSVTSGSMEPAIPVGSLLFAGKFSYEGLKNGDVITYQKTPENGEPVVITHRIVDIKKTESTKVVGEGDQQQDTKVINYDFVTKGDANAEPDHTTVKAGEIIGLYQWHIPKLGYLTAFAQTQLGFVLLVLIPAIILVVWEAVSLALHLKQGSNAKKEKEIEELKAELAKHKQSNA